MRETARVREPDWGVVLPVKRLSAAKSRLRGAVPGVSHERLVLAIVRDTVAAVVGCPAVAQVLAITDDPEAGAALRALGARVEPDRPDAGLNPALAYGASLLAAPGRGVAALTADLPALRPTELAEALRRTGAAGAAQYVPDAAGSGTTLLAAPPGRVLAPRFGPGSARAHAESGALPLAGDWPTLRRDVDTGADLAEAAALGLGPDSAAVYGAGMQATVATYDPATRSGTLLLDDGTELTFPAEAFEGSGLRLLRSGQRVRIDVDERDASRVVRLAFPVAG